MTERVEILKLLCSPVDAVDNTKLASKLTFQLQQT
jgi:hypothetical protein